jgi:hypothetical protein
MAVRVFRGTAPAIAQQSTYTVTDVTNGNTYILTITDGNTNATQAETYANGSGETVTTVAAGIAALITKSTKAQFQALTATSSAGVVTITAKIPGAPWSLAVTGTASAPTAVVVYANSGPFDFNCIANYDGQVIAGSSDDIIFVGSATVKYNLYQAGTTFGKLSTSTDFTGTIGAVGIPFQGACTDLDVYGSGQSHWDLGSSAVTPYVWGTATLANNAFACSIKGSALTNIALKGGSLAVAPMQGQTSTVTLVSQYGGYLLVGSGTTLTTFRQTGGVATILCAATTVTGQVGTMLIDGSGAITTVNVVDSNVTWNSTGTITTLNTKGNGVFDARQSQTARTITNGNIAGPTLYDTSFITITTKNVYNVNYDNGVGKGGIVPPIG